jgi:hypothetical protein
MEETKERVFITPIINSQNKTIGSGKVLVKNYGFAFATTAENAEIIARAANAAAPIAKPFPIAAVVFS